MMKTHKIGIFLALFLLVGFSSCKEQNTASKLLINEVEQQAGTERNPDRQSE